MAIARLKSSLRVVVAVLSVAVLSMLFVAVPSAEAAHVEPEFKEGNPTCSAFEPDGESWTQFKVDGDSDGGATDEVDSGTYSDGTLTVEVTVRDTDDGPVLDWDANLAIDAVFVKGGPNGNLYEYDPEVSADTGLHSPFNEKSGKYYGLSHVSFCYDVEQPPAGPAGIDLTVDKVNDADGDGVFSDSETAPVEGATVDFRVTVAVPEGSEVPVDLSSATDVYPTGDSDTSNDSVEDLFELCDELSDDTVIAPGESVTCTFTLEDYAPAAGESIQDTVVVEGHEQGNADNTVSDQDDSTVETEEDEVLNEQDQRNVVTTPTPLPAIAVTKTALVDPDEGGRMVVTFVPGDGDEETVTYRYVVTNTGDTTLEQVELTDDVLGTIALDDTELAPGESTIATATHVVTAADAGEGEIVNVATAVGTSPEGDQVRATDDARVLVAEVRPAMEAAGDVRSAVATDDRLPGAGADPLEGVVLAIMMMALGGATLLWTRMGAARA